MKLNFINDVLESRETRPYLVKYEYWLNGEYNIGSVGIFARDIVEAKKMAALWADTADFTLIGVSPIYQEDQKMSAIIRQHIKLLRIERRKIIRRKDYKGSALQIGKVIILEREIKTLSFYLKLAKSQFFYVE